MLAKGKTEVPRYQVSLVRPETRRQEDCSLTTYNTAYEFGLPFPADNLDNFFRNGGLLNLAYADITAATGSGHDDSKGATGADATGYTGDNERIRRRCCDHQRNYVGTRWVVQRPIHRTA